MIISQRLVKFPNLKETCLIDCVLGLPFCNIRAVTEKEGQTLSPWANTFPHGKYQGLLSCQGSGQPPNPFLHGSLGSPSN